MKIAFIYGLLAGSIIAAWDFLNYLYLYKTFLGRISFLIDLGIFLVFLFLGIKKIKSRLYGNQITFGNASLAGIGISLIASLTLSLLTFMYYSVSNHSYEEFYIAETLRVMHEKKLPDVEKTIADLKTSFKPFNQARGAFLVTMLLGGVFSFLFGMIFRNKLPESSFHTLNDN